MLEAGSIVGGKYRLQRLVGAGAMATVWAASHDTLGRQFAVKCIRAEAVTSQETIARCLREARIVASIRHRFIVDIFDFGTTEDGMPFMVMELLKGESLAERIAVGPPTPLRTFLGFVDMALTALAVAHRAGIIHRDLKPENIFLDHDSDGAIYPKLVDFGISLVHEPFTAIRRIDHLERGPAFEAARVAAGDLQRLTEDGVIIGTPAYMSPEQVRDVPDLDLRTDLYSMGVIMYEALSGTLPHTADTVSDLMVRIATEDAAPLEALRPELGRALSDVVARAMARRREDRFEDAGEMRRALASVDLGQRALFTVVVPGSHRRTTTDALVPDGLLPAEPVAAPEAGDELKTIPTASPPRRGRARGRLLLAAIVTLVLGAAAGVFAVASSGPAPPARDAFGAPESPAALSPPAAPPDAAPTSDAAATPPGETPAPAMESPEPPPAAPLGAGPAADASSASWPPDSAAPPRPRPPRRREAPGPAPLSFRDPGF